MLESKLPGKNWIFQKFPHCNVSPSFSTTVTKCLRQQIEKVQKILLVHSFGRFSSWLVGPGAVCACDKVAMQEECGGVVGCSPHGSQEAKHQEGANVSSKATITVT